jgi:hypothetical protein|tara:strand:+ start:145 stop:357 length:213 start_codon:yes stop_codon:yes gene_type:complete
MKLQPIKDVEGYRRDPESGAVLSVDNRALLAYKLKKRKQNEVLDDINIIKHELGELREMLKLILSSNKGT